jgi:hypothetical protein
VDSPIWPNTLWPWPKACRKRWKAHQSNWTAPQATSVRLYSHIVYDTVCSPSTIDVAQRVLAPGGRLVAIASAKPGQQVTLDYSALYALGVVGRCLPELRPQRLRRSRRSSGVRPGRRHPAAHSDVRGRRLRCRGRPLESHGQGHIKILLTPRRLLGSRPLLAACPSLTDNVR